MESAEAKTTEGLSRGMPRKNLQNYTKNKHILEVSFSIMLLRDLLKERNCKMKNASKHYGIKKLGH